MPAQDDQDRQLIRKSWVAILLTWVAGCIDGIGYLVLFHLFTAHMSGNSVAFGVALARLQWSEVAHRGIPIALFVVGVMLGVLVLDIGKRRQARHGAAIAFGLEILCLLAFLLYGSSIFHHGAIQPSAPWQYYLLAATAVVAMGLQTATLRRVGGTTVRTTFVTGTISNIGEAGSAYLFWLRDHWRERGEGRLRTLRRSLREPECWRVLLLSSIWTAYILGAIWGGYTEMHWNLRSVLCPIAALAGLVALDLWRPICLP